MICGFYNGNLWHKLKELIQREWGVEDIFLKGEEESNQNITYYTKCDLISKKEKEK